MGSAKEWEGAGNPRQSSNPIDALPGIDLLEEGVQVLDQIRRDVRRHGMLPAGALVVVAVSGGPDSAALLHALHALSGEFGVSLHVFHMDHGLRGESSREDARYVQAMSVRLGLPVTVAEVSPGTLRGIPGSLEANARTLRYREMEALAVRLGASHVALGHNLNDQAETVLMRLLRGAGARGLAGIPPVRREGAVTYVRPLLSVARSEIEEYCRAAELFPRLDESNLKPDYLRNRIRLQLLPQLQREYNPALVGTLAQTAALLRDEDDLLDQLAAAVLDRGRVSGGGVAFRGDAVLAEPVALARRVVRLAAREAVGEEYELGLSAVTQVLEGLGQREGSLALDLPGGLRAVVEYGVCRLLTTAEEGSPLAGAEWPLAGEGVSLLPEVGLQVELLHQGVPHGPWEAAFDADRLPGPLSVRFRRPGDRIYPTGMTGSRKLQDLLVDAKVPRRLRDGVPLLAAGEEVIWVIGRRLDRRYLAHRLSRNILLVRVKRLADGTGDGVDHPNDQGGVGCRGV